MKLLLLSTICFFLLGASGDRVIHNPNPNKDLVLSVNKGGVSTEALRVDGVTGKTSISGLGKYQEADLDSPIILQPTEQKITEFTVEKSGTYRMGFEVTFFNDPSKGSITRYLQGSIRVDGTAFNLSDCVTSLLKGSSSTGAHYAACSRSIKQELIAGEVVSFWSGAQNGGCCQVAHGTLWINPILQ